MRFSIAGKNNTGTHYLISKERLQKLGKQLSIQLSRFYFTLFSILGTRDCAVTVVRALASHQCGPGSIPGLGVICGLSLLLVLVLVPRGFSPGTPVFPSPQKPTLLNSNSIWKVSPIVHFTVVSLVTWPWIISEAGVDLVLIETSLLFICKSCCSYAN